MDRVVEDLVGLRQLDHVAEVHDADAVGDVLDDGQVVRDEHVGQVLVLLEVEQSSAETASSQTTNFGFVASARAMPMR